MVLEPSGLKHLLKLARLEIGPQEMDTLYSHLVAVLSSLEARSCAAQDEAASPQWQNRPSNRFRPDCIGPSLGQDTVLGNAPQTRNGCFTVPRILAD